LLYNKEINKEVYRFTWIRTFHNPITIRIEKTDEKYKIYWKICSGKGGFYHGVLKANEEKQITKEEWKKFQKLLDLIDFWNLKNNGDLMGTDGSQWILEGTTTKKYQVVDRFSPHKGQYYEACNFLIELTNLKIGEKEKY
jgi:hypothetical protein